MRFDCMPFGIGKHASTEEARVGRAGQVRLALIKLTTGTADYITL